MTRIVTLVVALLSFVCCADLPRDFPYPRGHAIGIEEAQRYRDAGTGVLLAVGGVLVALGIVLAVRRRVRSGHWPNVLWGMVTVGLLAFGAVIYIWIMQGDEIIYNVVIMIRALTGT